MSSSPSDHDMSDSSSSGTSYMRYSPYHSPSQQVPQLTTDLTELTCAENKTQFLKHATKPFLRITEQPQNHFRFRYVSEMIGTHGCLLGQSYASSKTKTHPTVELVNYPGQALIRCHLAQPDKPDEHPHKLLEDEQDRDVSQHVPEQGSYKVAFGGIGIIHTAKKDVAALLMKKYMERNNNIVVGNVRDLQSKFENMAKTINLNIVRLKFSAHNIHTGEEICDPVFSEPIHNMKSAATNDLKICRISRSCGSAAGGEDVFILVEKVNKKNIMIRFFELDENGQRCWQSLGQFMQSDVHHQYAIVFRTPPYKDCKTPVDVPVFVELVRMSDGRTSDRKEFKYKAEPAYKQIKKRKTNSSYCSIGSSSSGSLKSNCDIPITVVNHQDDHLERDVASVPSAYGFALNQLQYPTSPNECDLASALAGSEPSQSPLSSPVWGQAQAALPPEPSIIALHLTSADFDPMRNVENNEPENRILSEGMSQFFSEYLKSYSEEYPGDKALESLEFRPSTTMVTDSGRATYIKQEPANDAETARHQSSMKTTASKDKKSSEEVKKNAKYDAFYNTDDGVEVKKLLKELCDMIRNKKGYKKQEVRSRLEQLFNIRLSNGDTFLHMSLCSNQPTLEYIVKIIHNVKATHLLDSYNDRLQTTLHLAVLYDMPKIVNLLVAKGANPMLEDDESLNAIHYAVKHKSCLEVLLDAIKKNNVPCNLNDCNSAKQSALHMAVVTGSERSTRLLLQHGASCCVRDEHGRTPLHLAACDDRRAVVHTLLQYIPQDEIDVLDDSGNTALQIVCGSTGTRENTLAIAKLLLDKKANPLKTEDGRESAWRLVRNKPELKALVREYVSLGDMMDEDDIKSEPEDDFESADEGEYAAAGLQELPAYIREVALLLDAAAAWRPLAQRLRLEALLQWYAAQPSPSHTLLNHLKDSRDDVTSKSLALILEDMGQTSAANIIRRCIE